MNASAFICDARYGCHQMPAMRVQGYVTGIRSGTAHLLTVVELAVHLHQLVACQQHMFGDPQHTLCKNQLCMGGVALRV